MTDSAWRYCTAEQCREVLYSFRLFGEKDWSMEEQERCLYTLSNHVERYYRKVYIPKKNGKKRKLLIPDPILLQVQRNILSEILMQMPVSNYAKAYQKGSDISKMASVHKNQKKVLHLDIHDFFGNITYRMVYQQVFSQNRFPSAIGTLLAHLCCYRDYLPQGAPTSPVISNLVLKPFDDYVGRWCRESGIIYTRYCDDMVFSGDFDTKSVIHKVRAFLAVMGFSLNEKKSEVRLPYQRQSVLGIVVNEKVQVSREYRRNVHQEVYYSRKYGVDDHLTYLKNGEEKKQEKEKYLLSLLGKVNYILQINPQDKLAKADQAIVKELLKTF